MLILKIRAFFQSHNVVIMYVLYEVHFYDLDGEVKNVVIYFVFSVFEVYYRCK